MTAPAYANSLLVSTDGQRRVDGVPPTPPTSTQAPGVPGVPGYLTEVVAAVHKRVPVFLDGGIRRGTDVFKALAVMRKMQGLKFDIMTTSFFLNRRSFKAARNQGLPTWQERVFISMSKGLCIRWSENFIAMARTSFIASSRRLADAWRARAGFRALPPGAGCATTARARSAR